MCLFIAASSVAQEGTASPYSYYGIGEIKFLGTAENRSMGGLSIFRDSIHLNIQNPASYSNLKLTSFAVGGTTNLTTSKSDGKTADTQRTTLDYLAVGLPVGKIGIGFGIAPYSSVGYKIENRTTSAENINIFNSKVYAGTGGINRIFAGISYNITKNLNLGANLNYSFGKISSDVIEYRFIDGVQYGTNESNSSSVKGINATFGLQYQASVNTKNQFSTSMIYEPENSLNFTNQRTLNVAEESASIAVPNTSVVSPTKISFGLGYGQARKWQVGTEIVWQENSKMTNRFNDAVTKATFENTTKYIIGGYFIPKYNSFDSYFSRVVYRAGINMQNTGLLVNNQAINNQAFTVGLGLPLNGTFSNVNVGFEFGKRGTTTANLVQENYFNMTVGLSFDDQWFVKRKYD